MQTDVINPDLNRGAEKQKKGLFSIFIILIIILFLGFIYLAIVGIGLYFFNWRAGFVKVTAQIVPYPAAWVNIFPISFSEVFREKAHAMKFYQQTGSPLPQEDVLEKKTIDILIRHKMIQNLVSKYHLSVSNDEVKKTLDKLYEENGGKQSFEEILWQFYGYRPKEIYNLVVLSLMQEKLIAHFEDNILKKVHLAHILVQDETQAKNLLKQAKEKDFSLLAKNNSLDKQTKDKNGELGYFAQDELVKVILKDKSVDKKLLNNFIDKVWKAKQGEVFIFHTDRGWQVIKVLDFKGQEEREFEDWFSEQVNKALVFHFV